MMDAGNQFPANVAADAQAELAGRIAVRLNRLPRDEFGQEYALAVTAAYRRAEAVVVDELRLLCAVHPARLVEGA